MALLFLTGFDYYNQTQTQRVWPYQQGGNALVPGRFGGQGWIFNAENAFLSTVIPNSSTVCVGFALSMAQASNVNPILCFQDGTTDHHNPITQVDMRVTSTGDFQFYRNGVYLTGTGDLLIFNAWNYVEVMVYVSGGSGIITFRLNGETYLEIPALNTQFSGNNYVNQIRFQPYNTTDQYQIKLDDIYIINDQGPAPQNTYLGECRVQTQWPTANGDTNSFQVVGAGYNYQAVNSTISNDDLDYVKSATVGNIDDYSMGAVSLTGAIFGVQVNLTYKKDDVGNRIIAPVIKSANTFYQGPMFTCFSDYKVASNIWSLEPHGNTAWTNTSVSAIDAGIKITG